MAHGTGPIPGLNAAKYSSMPPTTMPVAIAVQLSEEGHGSTL